MSAGELATAREVGAGGSASRASSAASIARANADAILTGSLAAATAVLTMVYNILTHGENIALQTDFSTRTIRMQTVLEKQPRRKAA